MKSQYVTFTPRAWTKENLGQKIEEILNPYPASAIIRIEVGVDFQFFWPWRRNWAMIVLRRPEEDRQIGRERPSDA